MKTLKTVDPGLSDALKALASRGASQSGTVEKDVAAIISRVRREGDNALRDLTERYDGHRNLHVTRDALARACDQVDTALFKSMERARDRIEAYHRRQIQNSWMHTEENGAILGQIVQPIATVGIYVPGGKAVYPSSVFMNAIPARVAGVESIVMVVPAPPQGPDPVVLAAANLCGIETVFQIGGAQAVAALAFGTETVPKVDKIVGPGNIYVATAKKLLFGEIDIDMIAGPSEILIVSDGSGSPAWVAADMLSQAEHDEAASSILITTEESFADEVKRALVQQLGELPSGERAKRSLENNGVIIIAESIHEAVSIAAEIAPEHLELFVDDPWSLLPHVKNAGAVFLGYHTPEPAGDYIAGPNHVLPTGGTARFFSPLSVDDFIKKTSLISFTPQTLSVLGDDIVRLARSERLEAHAQTVRKRMKEV